MSEGNLEAGVGISCSDANHSRIATYEGEGNGERREDVDRHLHIWPSLRTTYEAGHQELRPPEQLLNEHIIEGQGTIL